MANSIDIKRAEYEKANALVQAFGKRVGRSEAKLDHNNDCSFGGFGLSYNSEEGLLVGRVLIVGEYPSDVPPEIIENFNKVARALNNPEIGGMFESAGGYFVLDNQKRMFFLMKDYELTTVDADKLYTDMQDLIDLGAVWTIRWFSRVARITHGREAAPVKKVTRQDLAD